MKADILKAEALVNNTGNNMLRRMLLHKIEPAAAVNNTLHLDSGVKRTVGEMLDIIRNLNIINRRAVQISLVGGLTASLRKECRAVKNNSISPALFLAGNNPCRKFKHMGVGVV